MSIHKNVAFLKALPITPDDSGRPVFRLADIKAVPGIRLFLYGADQERGLAVRAEGPEGNEGMVEFAVFNWDGADDDNGALVDVFWCGVGFGGALREMRHSWFGFDPEHPGYVFYAPLDVMGWAIEDLKRYFD